MWCSRIGPAGTGKTYLAVVLAMDYLKRNLVDRVILVRPAVEAGEQLGFLPGDLQEKINPYLRPLYDALSDLIGPARIGKYMESGIIEASPLAFMRGRTLNNAFVILDEAQNTTVGQMKMFLTRLGFQAKAVITGDVTQIDLASEEKSGLVHVREILADTEGGPSSISTVGTPSGIPWCVGSSTPSRRPNDRPAHRSVRSLIPTEATDMWVRLAQFLRRGVGYGRGGWGPRWLASDAAAQHPTRARTLAVLAGLLLTLLHLLLFPPLPGVEVDVLPEGGGIAEEDVRAPFAFSADLLSQDVEMRRIQKVLQEPPVLRRLRSTREPASLSRLQVFGDKLAQVRQMTGLTPEEQRQHLAVQFPYLESGEIERALAHPDPDALMAALSTAVEEVVTRGVADMLPPGQYNKVLVVENQAEVLRDLAAITPQGRLLEVLTEALRRAGLAPADAVWAATLARRFVTPNLIYDAEETRAKQDLARQTVATSREFIQGEKIVGRGDRVTEQQALYLEALRARLRDDRSSTAGAGEHILAVLARLLAVLLVLGVFGWLGWVYFRAPR